MLQSRSCAGLSSVALSRFARTDSTFLRLKVRTVDFLEWLLGGPFVYDGPDLFVAHASMHIDNLSYTQMMKLYRQVLVDVEDIDDLTKEEFLSVLEAQRAPIVDPHKDLAVFSLAFLDLMFVGFLYYRLYNFDVNILTLRPSRSS